MGNTGKHEGPQMSWPPHIHTPVAPSAPFHQVPIPPLQNSNPGFPIKGGHIMPLIFISDAIPPTVASLQMHSAMDTWEFKRSGRNSKWLAWEAAVCPGAMASSSVQQGSGVLMFPEVPPLSKMKSIVFNYWLSLPARAKPQAPISPPLSRYVPEGGGNPSPGELPDAPASSSSKWTVGTSQAALGFNLPSPLTIHWKNWC